MVALEVYDVSLHYFLACLAIFDYAVLFDIGASTAASIIYKLQTDLLITDVKIGCKLTFCTIRMFLLQSYIHHLRSYFLILTRN